MSPKSQTAGAIREKIDDKMNKWLESKMEKGKLIKNEKHLSQIETIKKQQFDRVGFLATEKGQGPLTEKDSEWKTFPSPIGTRLTYIKKDKQDYYELLKKKKQEAIQKTLYNYDLAKTTNAAMTVKPLTGTIQELKRGGLESRNKAQFHNMLDSIKGKKKTM